MRVLSLFDGMSCGMLAMQEAGITVDRYVAYEIDKYAIQTSQHNSPMIEHRGDVFKADFTEFRDFDFLIGGSPCTYWSIAKTQGRETEASGMGWELFQQYVSALHEAKPKWFIYENNKSMSKAIRASIDEAFGFEAICINSALVSAQNRQRLYWVGKRNDDGTYSKVNVEQPEDRGILLKDILESGVVDKEKAYCLKHQAGNARDYFKKHHTQIALEPVAINTTADGNKARTLMAGYYKYGTATLLTNPGFTGGTTAVAEPIGIGYRGRMENGKWVKRYESNGEERANAITTAQTDSMVAEPICLNSKSGRGGVEGLQPSLQDRIYSIEGKHTAVTTAYMPKIAEPIRVGTWPNNAKNQDHDSQQYRIYSTEGKGVTLCGNGGGMGAKTGLYAISVEFDGDKPIKAISMADGKTYTVYEVKDGYITINGKQYPIKLVDGYYIIRKLTVRECMRLQTVPEWFEFPVSDTQAYKMLGNGWTVAVIHHLLDACMKEE